MKSSFLKSISVLAFLSSTSPVLAADPVVAIVDGKKFTYSEVMKAKNSLPKQYQSLGEDKLFPILLNQLIDTYVINKASKGSKEASSPEVKKAIEKATEDIVSQAYLLAQIKDKVSDGAVKAKCDEILKAYKPEKEIHLYHILVDSENTAKAVIRALEGGTEFKKLAESKSKDATANKGGDLGYFRKEELPKELAEAAFELAAGSYSKKPIKTDFGWHVLKVGEIRDAKPPRCEDIQGEIKTLLAQEAILKVLEDLRAKAKLQIFDKDGKPIQEKAKKAAAPAPKK